MKSYWIQVVSLILAGLISMPAHAEVIPGRWEIVSALDLGTPIAVELKNGDRIEGEFEDLSESEVDIETHSARAVIPNADIQTATISSKDGLGDGVKIGAAMGFGLGLGTLGIAALIQGGLVPAYAPLMLLIAGGIGSGVGAGIGAAADAEDKEREYRGLRSAWKSSALKSQRFGMVTTQSAESGQR